jgi:hypothetical protein
MKEIKKLLTMYFNELNKKEIKMIYPKIRDKSFNYNLDFGRYEINQEIHLN